MKKWNLLLLVGFIILTILLAIPVFQNAAMPVQVTFYGGMRNFTNVYLKALFLGIADWSLLLLYIQSLLKDIKRQGATKFDLDK